MKDLRVYNEYLYNEYLSLNNKEELSSPLLVSSKRFLDNIKEHPIMYIGQETNGWVNYNINSIQNIKIDTIEDAYDSFLMDQHTSKSLFWTFIRKCLDSDYDSIYKNVVWCNTLYVGKRYSKGKPKDIDNIKEESLNYLLFLYEYFEPSLVIDVSGNAYPYNDITFEFLSKINSRIKMAPSNKYPIIIDKNVVWSYHPNRLSYINMLNPAQDKLSSKIKEL